MIDVADFERTAQARLEDARVLHRSGRYDGAVYMCGYAVEIALKSRMCRTLGWEGFPETSGEFSEMRLIHTHDLGLLLQLSGMKPTIRQNHFSEWSAISDWEPQVRYRMSGTASEADAELTVNAIESLLED